MKRFQFPSNGKVVPNVFMDIQMASLEDLRFNSLQTGKQFRTKDKKEYKNETGYRFQFPSNGKVVPNGNYNFQRLGQVVH